MFVASDFEGDVRESNEANNTGYDGESLFASLAPTLEGRRKRIFMDYSRKGTGRCLLYAVDTLSRATKSSSVRDVSPAVKNRPVYHRPILQ